MKHYLAPITLYLAHNFQQIKTASVYSSIGGTLLTMSLQIFTGLQKWATDNNDYIYLALGLVAIAHMLGSIVHKWYRHDFDWKKNILGFFIMLLLVICSSYISEALSHIVKDDNLIAMYVKMTGRLIVCVYPIRSAYKNMKIISNGEFRGADGMIKKLDRFSDNLDLGEFKERPTFDEFNNQNQEQ